MIYNGTYVIHVVTPTVKSEIMYSNYYNINELRGILSLHAYSFNADMYKQYLCKFHKWIYRPLHVHMPNLSNWTMEYVWVLGSIIYEVFFLFLALYKINKYI